MRINLNSLILKFKTLFFLFKNRGLKGTYNFIYYQFFFDKKYPLLIKFLEWFDFYPLPSSFLIGITTKCNLKCIMCPRTYCTYIERLERDMSFEKFKSIIEQLPNPKSISLTGRGEGLLNKDFIKMIKYLKAKNISVEFFDNFYSMDKKIAQELIDIGVDRIYASIDGATKATYEKIRVGSNFERVIDNVKGFFEIQREKNIYFPEISFNYVVNKYNLGEIIQFIELVYSLTKGKKTEIRFSNENDNLFKEIKALSVPNGILKDTIKKAIKKGKELGIPVILSSNMLEVKPPITECINRFKPFIMSNGYVFPCMGFNQVGGGYGSLKKMVLGNIFEQSFKKIWNGEKYKTLRRMIRQGKVPSYCKNCNFYNVS